MQNILKKKMVVKKQIKCPQTAYSWRPTGNFIYIRPVLHLQTSPIPIRMRHDSLRTVSFFTTCNTAYTKARTTDYGSKET